MLQLRGPAENDHSVNKGGKFCIKSTSDKSYLLARFKASLGGQLHLLLGNRKVAGDLSLLHIRTKTDIKMMNIVQDINLQG